MFLSSAEEQHHNLCREDTQEHAQRINCRITYGWSLLGARCVGIGQGRRVGIGTCQHTHDGEVIELELQAGDGSDDEDRNHGDEESGVYILDTVALSHGLPESGTSLDAHASQEEHQSYLTQHHVG